MDTRLKKARLNPELSPLLKKKNADLLPDLKQGSIKL
jgi:hypothetical protein